MYKKNIHNIFCNRKILFYLKIICIFSIGANKPSIKEKKNTLNKKSKYPIIKINEKTNIECEKMNQILGYLTNPTIRGFLNFISICEGTARSTKNIEIVTPEILEYKVCFTNIICKNLVNHPGIIHQTHGTNGSILKSSASGRYQFISSTWKALENLFKKQKITTNYKHLVKQYQQNINNFYYDAHNLYIDEKCISYYLFGPFYQDLGALILIYLANAICDIINKNYKEAIYKLAPIWASLPSYPTGKSYYSGQPAFSMERALEICNSTIENAKKKIVKLKII
jgi:muramidase (phage lysozyme)